MNKIIVVTGGAGFVGSNLIELFLKKTKFKIVSLDNYSTGKKDNHHKNPKLKYISRSKEMGKKISFVDAFYAIRAIITYKYFN